MMETIGKPANVRICREPRLGGVEEALKWDNLKTIIERYKYRTDLFILCIDRDNEEYRNVRLQNLEEQAKQALTKTREKKLFVTVQAEQEVEVWLLAGQNLPKEWSWSDVRSERDPKEKYFEPFAEQRGYKKIDRAKDKVDRARAELGKEAATRYDRVRQLCPEVAALEKRIRDWIDELSK